MSAASVVAATMIFDTDVLIAALRGSHAAASRMNREPVRLLSVISYMELMRGARDKNDLRNIRSFLHDNRFGVLELSGDIGRKASGYMETLALRSGIEVADALIAATAAETGQPLCTGNAKHYRAIDEIRLTIFKHR